MNLTTSASRWVAPPFLYRFCSGVTRAVDFGGIVEAGMVPGIQVNDLNGRLRLAVLHHLRSGGALFVDSGAFPAFMAGRGSVDFDRVMERYAELVQTATEPERLFLVAPDKIADPDETLRLLSRYASQLKSFSDAGASILVPMQAGNLDIDMGSTWRSAVSVLPGVRTIPAMPMRAASVSLERIVRFLRDSDLAQVHLLGTSRAAHATAIRRVCPGVIITCDANRIRAAVGRNRPLTLDYRESVQERCIEAWRNGGATCEDGTEFTFEVLNTRDVLTAKEEDRVVAYLAPWCHEFEVRLALLAGALGNLLGDELAPIFCQYCLEPIHRARVAQAVGPTVRRESIVRHFARDGHSLNHDRFG